jgi:HlyD family secretion protein
MIRRLIFGAALLTTLVTCVVVANFRRNPSELVGVDWRIKRRMPPKEVQVAPLSQAEIVQTVTAPGKIELIEEADIASQIVGKVKKVLVKKGDVVAEGDLLVQLDDEDARARYQSTEARIEGLRAAIAMAKANLAKAERDSAGYQELAKRGFSTPTEVQDGITEVERQHAALEMAEQDLEESFAAQRTSEKELERTEIRAPINGTVTDLDVEMGEVVIAGTTNLPGTVLMRIGDMQRMRVRADVDESDVGLVRPGQPVKIYLQADQEVPVAGSVDLISPKGVKLNEVVTFETLINVEGGAGVVRPEMTATVEIEVKRAPEAWSLPVQAVVHRRLKDLPDTPLFRDWVANQPRTPTRKMNAGETQYVKVVFVMQDGVAYARPVETGISDQQRVEILAGVEADEQVIVGPFRALDEMRDDQPVKLEEPKPLDEDDSGNAAPGESA